ncbi:transmembrane protein 19 [Dorcoceras hygrometricum]|uniref:Transmembrane protein 19 n=1 Tax=Dorcoceras hygrometricum TaxID=472368 RepID=A0A2Z7C599_9LAMI|nr:transmembrane protein 19 [Dorcoceras hygrometricum]
MEINLIRPAVATLASVLVAAGSFRKKSLDLSGAIFAVVVMTVHIAVNYRFAAVLFAFFFTSSKLTKFGEERKRKVDADFKEGGQRNWIQVVSNSGIATLLVLIICTSVGTHDFCLDSKDSHLFTSLSPVRKGTNGGVTKAGLMAAAVGGSVIGLTFVLLGLFTTNCAFDIKLKQLFLIPLSALFGLCGSVVDSLLGATLQYSGFCTVRNKVVGKPGPTVKKISGLRILDNNAVNFLSILLTSLLCSVAFSYVF